MSDDPQTTPDLSDVRKRIDTVDRALLDLIAERLALSADVRRAKRGAKLWRPSREDEHVADLIQAATQSQTPPALVSRVWAELMSASISVQGGTRLHVSLEGDVRANQSLIRDRFGGSLPVLSYPTSSAALSACASDPEGIAVLPAPGGHRAWWTALGPTGATPQLKIVAALPRIQAGAWPEAVAVAAMDLDPSPAGRLLVVTDAAQPTNIGGTVRAQSGSLTLLDVPGDADLAGAFAVGYLPPRIN